MQQILAYETDLLEFDDIFDGSTVIDAKVEALKAETRAELERIGSLGGAVAAIETGALKRALVESNARRIAAIERGEQVVVGVKRFETGEPSPLTAGDGAIFTSPRPSRWRPEQRIRAWRSKRDGAAPRRRSRPRIGGARGPQHHAGLDRLRQGGRHHRRVGRRLREVFGEYRAPTGVTLETASSGAAEEAAC